MLASAEPVTSHEAMTSHKAPLCFSNSAFFSGTFPHRFTENRAQDAPKAILRVPVEKRRFSRLHRRKRAQTKHAAVFVEHRRNFVLHHQCTFSAKILLALFVGRHSFPLQTQASHRPRPSGSKMYFVNGGFKTKIGPTRYVPKKLFTRIPLVFRLYIEPHTFVFHEQAVRIHPACEPS